MSAQMIFKRYEIKFLLTRRQKAALMDVMGAWMVPDTFGKTTIRNLDFASEDTESMFIEIPGGTLYVNASGDGMDSNGSIRVSGGVIYISGPTDGANGALDYASSATITGGTLIAAGSSGMAESFSDASTQGVIMVNVDSQEADSRIQLSNADGNLLLSWTAPKGFSNVVVSCPDIIQGNTYTLDAGSSQTSITMDSFVYNGGSGMGSSMPQDAGNMPGGRRR